MHLFKMCFVFAALKNPQYKVPLHLIQMAQEENIKLQHMRYRNKHTHSYIVITFKVSNGF